MNEQFVLRFILCFIAFLPTAIGFRGYIRTLKLDLDDPDRERLVTMAIYKLTAIFAFGAICLTIAGHL